MRRAGKVLLVAGVVAALGATGTVFAYAGGWTLPDNPGSYTVKVAGMPRGVEPSVAKQGLQAVVTWSAQEMAPGVLMDHYAITAHSVSDPPRPDVTHTVAASGGPVESVTFTAAEVAGGKWRWTVVPRFRNWTGEESRRSQRLAFAAPAPQSVQVNAPAGAPGDPVAPNPAPPAPESPTPAENANPESGKPENGNPENGKPASTDPEVVKPDPSVPKPEESTPEPVASASPAAPEQ
ncbi:hypothetical protein OHA21_34580 [Actinoplanes sp. NBC_00393]|uniref:hypothetical protein n=1 Tax=Actinoplanes sp. NBC_00393 TaxID=2975953 RepID=UPI002E1CF6F3